jgi:hypothetical protein
MMLRDGSPYGRVCLTGYDTPIRVSVQDAQRRRLSRELQDSVIALETPRKGIALTCPPPAMTTFLRSFASAGTFGVT